jgi:2-methylcitrate dehydratase
MTGPPQPYEGSSGIWDQVTGAFELELPVQPDTFVVEQIATKTRPAEYNAQGPIDLMLELRELMALDDIEAIEVETYRLAYHEIGSDPAKWDPRTRETADHSLPYLLAVALVDGSIDTDSASEARVRDPRLRPLMNRIRITENAEFTERFPDEISARLTVRMRNGEEIARQTSYPRGHHRNPLSDDEIDQKYVQLTLGRSPADDAICEALRASLWQLTDVKDIGEVMVQLGRLTAGARVGGPEPPGG